MIFIFGIERSSTTWISNILEAHSSTEVYMEPLSIYSSRFRKWPNRLQKIEDVAEMSQYFWKEFALLTPKKRLFLSRLSDASWAWNSDFAIGGFLRKYVHSDRVNDFMELNFHRKGEYYHPPKKKSRVDVIKELRLNFNAPVIRTIDPEARVLVVVRDAASNILSIIRNIKAGNIVELKSILQQKFGGVNIDSVFDYWQRSYNTLLSGLDETGIPYKIIMQKTLIKDSKKTVEELLAFLKLKPEEGVYHYLQISSERGQGAHDTHRDPKQILARNEKARKKLHDKLQQKAAGIGWHPALKDEKLW